MSRRKLGSILLAAALLLAATPGAVADDEAAIVSLDIDSGGSLDVALDAPGKLNPVEAAGALSKVLGCRRDRFVTTISGGTQVYHLEGVCKGALARQPERVEGHWDFASFGALLHDRGLDQLEIHIGYPDTGSAAITPEMQTHWVDLRRRNYGALWWVDDEPASIAVGIEFGFRSIAPLFWFAGIGAGLTILGTAAAWRVTARAKQSPDKARARFAVVWGSKPALALGIAAWSSALVFWHIPERLLLLLGLLGPGRFVAAGVLCALPIVIVQFALNYRTLGLWPDLPGQPKWRRLVMWVFFLALAWIPILLIVLLGSDLSGDRQPMGWWFSLWGLIVLIVIGAVLRRRGWGRTVSELEQGELRQRVDAMAAAAGTMFKRQVLVRGPLLGANAWVRHGAMVIFTEDLIRKLARRELDGIVVMELARLKLHHIAKLNFLQLAYGIAISLGVAVFSYPLFFLYPWAVVAVSLLSNFIQRRLCRSRDRLAGKMAEDPAALISAMTRLCEINLEPLDRPAWQGLLVTHPPMGERLALIAASAGLDEHQRAAAIAAGHAPPGEGYALSAS